MVKVLETKDAFDEALAKAKQRLVVVDFTARWCGPCQEMAPAYARMAKEMPEVEFYKVDVDDNEETAEECRISVMPTFQLFLGGKRIGQVKGAEMNKLYAAIVTRSQQIMEEASSAKLPEPSVEPSAKKRKKQSANEEVDEAPTEASLNLACAWAKAALKAHPESAELIAQHAAAKSAFKAFRSSEAKSPAAKSPSSVGGGGVASHKALEEDSKQWTCEMCNVTLFCRADGHARTQHLNGKSHCKKVKQQEQQQQQQAAAEGTAADEAKPAGKVAGMFTCQLCACTGAASARLMHESGSKHCSKLAQVAALLGKGGQMQKGDWLCVRHGPNVQHNFASKTRCLMKGCDGVKAQGLTFEQAERLAAKAWRAGKAKEAGGEDAAEDGFNDEDEVVERGKKGKKEKSGKDADKAAGKKEIKPSKAPAKASDADVKMDCKDCGTGYAFSVREQQRYEENGFQPPTRCLDCRSLKRKRAAAERE